MNNSRIKFDNIRSTQNSQLKYVLDNKFIDQMTKANIKVKSKPIVPVPVTNVDKILVKKFEDKLASN
jgi:hypothetical protein